MWSKDGKIDVTDIISESAKIPVLHNKYHTLYTKEYLKIKKLRADLIRLEKDKHEYYSGTMSEKDLKERGWEPFRLRVLKAELQRYMDSDEDIINLSLKITYHESIWKFLEDIVKQINGRSFVINGIIKMLQFQQGVN